MHDMIAFQCKEGGLWYTNCWYEVVDFKKRSEFRLEKLLNV